jgi:hypothetical protein
MLQAAGTHLIIPEPSEDLISNEPWSIEFDAEGLMDELFADVDEILHGSGNLPGDYLHHNHRPPRSIEETPPSYWVENSAASTTPVATYEPVQTINVPPIVLPNTFIPTPAQKEDVGTVVINQPGKITQRQQARLNLTKLLITGTTIGIAIAGTLHILNSQFPSILGSQVTELDISLSQTEPQVDPQAELVDYMLRALAIIEQRAKSNNSQNNSQLAQQPVPQPLSVATPSNAGDLTPPLAANNTLPVVNPTTNVVERIYIPVYQAPSPMRFAPPPQIATNTPTSPTSPPQAVNNNVSANQPANTNQVAAVPSAPMSVNQQPASVNVPSLPTVPTRPPIPVTLNPQQAFVPSTSPTPSHTLAGLLELGDKSAALFENEGVTRRIHIGESIGATGWTLVDIANGEAIVRRNGEVRSIFAGQRL